MKKNSYIAPQIENIKVTIEHQITAGSESGQVDNGLAKGNTMFDDEDEDNTPTGYSPWETGQKQQHHKTEGNAFRSLPFHSNLHHIVDRNTPTAKTISNYYPYFINIFTYLYIHEKNIYFYTLLGYDDIPLF